MGFLAVNGRFDPKRGHPTTELETIALATRQQPMNATAINTHGTHAIGPYDDMTKRAPCRLRNAILAVGAIPGVAFGRRPAAMLCTLTLLQTASLLLAPDARAQSNACDLLKIELAARIEATGVRGYSLEDVPADTPVPPDARAIGNCEAGARKVLYRRWGATQPPPAAAPVTGPASAARPGTVPDKKPQPSAGAQSVRTVPPPSAPALASAPSAAAQSVSPSRAAASTAAAPAHRPETAAAAASAVEAAAVRTPEPVAPQSPPVPAGTPPEAAAPWSRQATEFIAANWRWIGALIALPLAVLIWLWFLHRRAYDAAGLPRGPKL
jgi:hypothetical protein